MPTSKSKKDGVTIITIDDVEDILSSNNFKVSTYFHKLQTFVEKHYQKKATWRHLLYMLCNASVNQLNTNKLFHNDIHANNIMVNYILVKNQANKQIPVIKSVTLIDFDLASLDAQKGGTIKTDAIKLLKCMGLKNDGADDGADEREMEIKKPKMKEIENQKENRKKKRKRTHESERSSSVPLLKIDSNIIPTTKTHKRKRPLLKIDTNIIPTTKTHKRKRPLLTIHTNTMQEKISQCSICNDQKNVEEQPDNWGKLAHGESGKVLVNKESNMITKYSNVQKLYETALGWGVLSKKETECEQMAKQLVAHSTQIRDKLSQIAQVKHEVANTGWILPASTNPLVEIKCVGDNKQDYFMKASWTFAKGIPMFMVLREKWIDESIISTIEKFNNKEMSFKISSKYIRFLFDSQKRGADDREERGGYFNVVNDDGNYTELVAYTSGKSSHGDRGRNTWVWSTPKDNSDSPYIWHTHPKKSTGFPSKEDIWKVLHNSDLSVSFLITFKGIWQLTRWGDTVNSGFQDFVIQYRQLIEALAGLFGGIKRKVAFIELAGGLADLDACKECNLTIKYTTYNEELDQQGYYSDYSEVTFPS